VTVHGFPNFRLGDSGVAMPGQVVGFRTVSTIRRLLISASIVAGNSGGPVLDAKNRVLGIAVTGADSFENAEKTENHGVIPITALNLLSGTEPRE
jgi:RNA-directed DNA polymerase